MARTASMTPDEAEALLGQRGALNVNQDNRKLVRKWLVAMGVRSTVANEATMLELAMAYNDQTNASVEALKKQEIISESATDESNEDDEDDAPQHNSGTINGATNGATNGTANEPAPDVQHVATLLTQLLATSRNSVDANQVNTIIESKWRELPELIAKHSPVTRIEIKTPNETRTTEPAPHHYLLPLLIKCLSVGIPVALVGPAGSGKTTAAEQATHALNKKFYIQGAVQGGYELTGAWDAYGKYHSTPFRAAFEHGGTICLDELDAGDPGGILVCNSALANNCMPFPDQTEPVNRHPDFNVVACLNTFGFGADRLYVGRNQLDAATLDRFAFIKWPYDARLEQVVACGEIFNNNAPKADTSTCTPRQWVERVQAIRKGVEHEKARMCVSPRASIYGVKLLAAGVGRADCEDLLIWKGCDADLRQRIETVAAQA